MTLKLQVAWPDGQVASFPAGGAIEKEVIADILNRVEAKPVGLLKTKRQVVEAVRAAVNESFAELKARTRQGFQ